MLQATRLRITDIYRYLRSQPLLSLLPIFVLFMMMLSSLALLSDATQNSVRFERLYLQLLVINIVGLLILSTLITLRIIRFIRDFRSGVMGSRLALRLIIMFLLVSAIPVSAVYYFSLQFLEKGIDNWFDVQIEQALEDALELSRTSMDLHIKQLVDETDAIRAQLHKSLPSISHLSTLQWESSSHELTLLSTNGRVIATASQDQTVLLPQSTDQEILMQVRLGYNYVGLEPHPNGHLMVRIVSLIDSDTPFQESIILQALYNLPKQIGPLIDNVNDSFAYYKEMVYLRGPIKNSFTLTLSLVLLLTLLTSIWIAFFSTQRLVEPIRLLALGTRSVASGDYDQKLPLTSYDEFGSLVNSFNEMTRKIAQARDDVSHSQKQTERERAYLRAVLGGLTSGVLTLDHNYRLRTVNAAARQVLEVEFEKIMGKPLSLLATSNEHMGEFCSQVLTQFETHQKEWQMQLTIFTPHGRKVLMCHGTRLAERHQSLSGFVLVIDNITNMLQVQRDAAWSEVARRLAHEIKNPLTPIQLAAERLRRRYLDNLTPQEGELLDRSTHTIIQQVEAMEVMVKAFSDYAYTPKLQLARFDLNQLIDEVVELYRGNPEVHFQLHLDPKVEPIDADKGRIRQLLHNLIKNAIEAVSGQADSQVTLLCELHGKHPDGHIELRIEDNGPGIPQQLFEQLFEPYITNKPKGTGLGLAIVKKIAEEHGGIVYASNGKNGGAYITVRLPLQYTIPVTAPSAPT